MFTINFNKFERTLKGVNVIIEDPVRIAKIYVGDSLITKDLTHYYSVGSNTNIREIVSTESVNGSLFTYLPQNGDELNNEDYLTSLYLEWGDGYSTTINLRKGQYKANIPYRQYIVTKWILTCGSMIGSYAFMKPHIKPYSMFIPYNDLINGKSIRVELYPFLTSYNYDFSSNVFTLNNTVTLYNNIDENIVVNKRLENGIKYNFVFKDKCSILDPVIVIEDFTYDITTKNYAYFEMFNRYYHINDIISVRRGVWELHLNCDVLMSFKDDILNQSALVSRNEFEYDDDIIDNQRSFSNEFVYKYINDGNGGLVKGRYNAFINMYLTKRNDDLEFDRPTLQGTGKQLTPIEGFSIGQYYETLSNYNNYCNFSMITAGLSYDSAYDNIHIKGIYEVVEDIITQISTLNIVYKEEPERYVTAVTIFPFDLRSFVPDNVTMTKVYGLSVNNGDAFINGLEEGKDNAPCYSFDYGLMAAERTISLESFSIPYSFMKYTSSISIHIPYIGWKEVDSYLILKSKNLKVQYILDPISTQLTAYLFVEDYEGNINFIGNYSGKCGFNIPVGVQATNEMLNRIAIGTINSLLTTFTGISFSSSSSYGSSERRLAGEEPKTSYFSNESSSIHKSLNVEGVSKSILDIVKGVPVSSGIVSQGTDGFTSTYGMSDFIVKLSYKEPIEIDNYNHFYGRPLMKTKTLKDVHGYTVVGSVHLTDILNATQDELTKLETLLYSGIILP